MIIENWVKEPEIYQMNRLCLRYNSKAKRVPICILLSTHRIYEFSVQKQIILPKELKSSVQISNIKFLSTYKNVETLISIILTNDEEIEETFTLRFYYKDDAIWLYVFH
jgi:hypothetical protein